MTLVVFLWSNPACWHISDISHFPWVYVLCKELPDVFLWRRQGDIFIDSVRSPCEHHYLQQYLCGNQKVCPCRMTHGAKESSWHLSAVMSPRMPCNAQVLCSHSSLNEHSGTQLPWIRRTSKPLTTCTSRLKMPPLLWGHILGQHYITIKFHLNLNPIPPTCSEASGFGSGHHDQQSHNSSPTECPALEFIYGWLWAHRHTVCKGVNHT